MKGHIRIVGDYDLLKPAIKQLDEIARYRDNGRSFDYDCGHCRADYFYDEYDTAELDYGIITNDANRQYITLEEW